MIYLIASAGFEKTDLDNIVYFRLLKIGYTNDSKKDIRYINYKLHNPTCIVLKEIPNATEKHEKLVQNKFKDLQYEKYGHEWFYYDQSIIDFFNSSTVDDLEKLNDTITIGVSNYSLKERNKELRKILKLLVEDDKINSYCNDIISSSKSNLTKKQFIDESIKYLTNLGFDLSGYHYLSTSEFSKDSKSNSTIKNFLKELKEKNTIPKKLKYIVNNKDKLTELEYEILLKCLSFKIRNYIAQLGLKEIKACGYNIHAMRIRIEQLNFNPDIIKNAIYSNFSVEDKYSLSELKDKISNIYSSIGYTETPRAIDITKYFEIKEISFYEKLGDGKRRKIRGYELLKKLY